MNASTTIVPKNGTSGILPPIGARRAVFAEVMEAARKAFPDIKLDGLTCVTADRAFFQVVGDPTYYSIAITRQQAEVLGYMVF